MGLALTWDLAADICLEAGRLETLVSPGDIERIQPRIHGDAVMARERMEDIVEEMKLLHQAHWKETEMHRHGLALNPDYDAFIRYERVGRYVLFTLRNDGRLQGNCALYLDKNTHTQTLHCNRGHALSVAGSAEGTDGEALYRVLRKLIKVAGCKGNKRFRQNSKQGGAVLWHAGLSPR